MLRRRRKRSATTEPDLPITPFLDFSFQLLFFFVLTFGPRRIEVQMALNLPATGQAKAESQEKADMSKDSAMELELPSELTVFIKADQGATSGGISQIVIDVRQGKIVVPYDPDLKGLTAKLVEMRKDLSNKDDVKIEAEARLLWNNVVRVMDACRRAEFKGIGFVPPPTAQ